MEFYLSFKINLTIYAICKDLVRSEIKCKT